jgi:hypothetical protein
VGKKYILALKLDRNEQEVITFMVRRERFEAIVKVQGADRSLATPLIATAHNSVGNFVRS